MDSRNMTAVKVGYKAFLCSIEAYIPIC